MSNDYSNKYNATPRKVFDKAIDKLTLRRERDRDDARADNHLLINQLKRMQLQLDELEDHVKSHCHVLQGSEEE